MGFKLKFWRGKIAGVHFYTAGGSGANVYIMRGTLGPGSWIPGIPEPGFVVLFYIMSF